MIDKAISQITLGKVLRIFQRTFDKVDPRLLGHGEKVAYIFWRMLKSYKEYDEKELLKLTSVAFFHDIGAFKTEDIDKMMEFEVSKGINHSIYSSMYIKYFSPLKDLWEIVLYHHDDYKDIKSIEMNNKDEASIFHLCDRIDILSKSIDEFNGDYLYKFQHKSFSKESIDLFVEVNGRENIWDKLKNGTYREELYDFLDNYEIPFKYTLQYAKMMVYSIDFRSPTTLTHSMAVAAVSRLIGEKLDLDDETLKLLDFSALVHDLGKITTPVEILEKPGKLTDEEMKIMQEHVVVTYEILNDLGFDKITKIASYHHEKLDGSGYPFGIKGKDLFREARIVAVADILSALIGARSYKDEFPKERVIGILNNMANMNKIDRNITELVIENYDELVENLKMNLEKTLNNYNEFQEQCKKLMNSVI